MIPTDGSPGSSVLLFNTHLPPTNSVLTNHQRCWIWGKHTVRETLEVGRWPMLELVLAEDLPPDEQQSACKLAQRQRIPVSFGTRKQLAHSSRQEDHQGYLAKMAEFPYAAPSVVWDSLAANSLFVILEEIHDSFNFGAMLRSCEAFAASAVIVGTARQSPVNSQVARSSVGAVNRLPIVRVENLLGFVQQLTARDVTVIGTSLSATTLLPQHLVNGPTAVIIGNEAQGLSDVLLAACSTTVRIPQPGATNSLNAAAALAIVCYEIRRQSTPALPQ